MFKIQMIQTNETFLNFENWNFGFACPVKWALVTSCLMYHNPPVKSKPQLRRKLLNRVKI